MTGIIFITVLFALLCFLIYTYILKPEIAPLKSKTTTSYSSIILLLGVGLLVRIIAGCIYKGYDTDMQCFSAWSDMVFKDGLSSFYASESFTDYPPGYMYVLYVIGFLKNVFRITEGPGLWLLIKSPAIICDIITAFLIYKISIKNLSQNVSLCITALYIFNIAVFLDSAVWGQVDSVFTLCIVGMIYLITQKKLIPSYFLFALAILIKPQALMFTPVLIFGVIEQVFLNDFSWKKFFVNLSCGLGAIIALVLCALPFKLDLVIEQYVDTLGSYAYASVNTFNLWGALNMNWEPLVPWMTLLGNLFIVLITGYSAVIFFRSKDTSKYYFVAAFLSFATLILSVKMHERYAFPCMALLLLAFITQPKKHTFSLYVLCSSMQFANMGYVLFLYAKDMNTYYRTGTFIIASIITVLVLVYMIYIAYKTYIAPTNQKKLMTVSLTNNPLLSRFDIIFIVCIVAVYSGIALFNLGDTKAPQSDATIQSQTVIDLGQETELKEMWFFLGSYDLNENRTISASVTNNPTDTATSPVEIEKGSVFAWNKQSLSGKKGRYIVLSSASPVVMREMAIYDVNSNKLTPSSDSVGLFDEQALVPTDISYRNGSYFDEIYHARTGYEFVNGLDTYEWTHPPLGKVFIALGIKLFGMTPFGWRIMGTLFGIFMVPVIYIFAKRLLKESWLAAIVCILLTFDFMHFAQTRIATIDVYVTFFIMLMYYYMYKYYSTSFYTDKLSKTLKLLALSGLFMGLGIASKWTGIYAGAGLAVLFFITLCQRYKEYRTACRKVKSKKTDTDLFIIDNFKPYTIKTLAFCLIFFIAVPAIIYVLSYIPYMIANGDGIIGMLKNQTDMFSYHAKTVLESTHPYSSRWYQWPIMVKPIWYYSGTISNTVKEGISSFGNPAVWWTGIAAFAYMLYLTIGKKDKTALFLVIAYLAQLVSWIPVTRITFIYHYFPCVPFITLMIGYSLLSLYRRFPKIKKCAFVYAGIVVVLFIMFYPVISGMSVNVSYVDAFLKWFSSWVLI